MNVSPEDMSRIFEEVQTMDSTNDRFKYLKVRRQDKWYFVKIAQNDEAREGLLREYLWSEFMERVTVLMPALKLDGPHIFKRIGTGALVFEWIDSAPVAASWDIEAWRRNMRRYADMHVLLDKAAGDYSLPQVYTKLAHRDTPETTWKRWSSDGVDEQTIEKAREVFRLYQHHVTLRLQHGDLWPWEIFAINDRWIVVDGERAGIDLPRFYDVARSYTKLYAETDNPEMAKEFLRAVAGGLGLPQQDFYKQLLPVLLVQAITRLSEASSRGDDNAKSFASSLVEICLSQQPERLFD